MKTIIVLVGAQGTLKNTFLNRLDILEFFEEDFKCKEDFANKPNLFGITTNDLALSRLDKLNTLCDSYRDANLLIVKLPSKEKDSNREFYQRLETFIKTYIW